MYRKQEYLCKNAKNPFLNEKQQMKSKEDHLHKNDSFCHENLVKLCDPFKLQMNQKSFSLSGFRKRFTVAISCHDY